MPYKPNWSIIGIWLVLCLFTLMSGCTQAWRITARSSLDGPPLSDSALLDDKRLRVAVLPFSAAPPITAADQITELFAAEMVSIPFFELVPRQQISELGMDFPVQTNALSAIDQALAMGKAVHADVVFVGHVSTYGLPSLAQPEQTCFGLVLHLIDTQTGHVLWRANQIVDAMPMDPTHQLDALVLSTVQRGITDLHNQLTRARRVYANQKLQSPPTPAVEAPETEQAQLSEEETPADPPPPISLKEVQSALAEIGISPGPIDGIYGLKTRHAIQSFQQEAGMTPDGAVSVYLWEMLQKAISEASGDDEQ